MARQTHETQLGALRVRWTEPGSRRGFRLMAQCLNVFGETIFGLIVEGKLLATLADPDKAIQVGGELMMRVAKMTPEEAEALADAVILGLTEVSTETDEHGNPLWTKIPDGDSGRQVVDLVIPSPFMIMGIIKHALPAYFFPTRAVASIDAATSTASTGTAERR